MAHRPRPAFLRLIHSESVPGRALSGPGPAAQAQDIFLPSNHPNTLIFLAWGKASVDELLDIFELAKPKLILDMRVAPRFDLGQLTRRRFFELLREYDCRYVDLFGRMGVDSVNDALVNPVLVASRAAEFTEKLRVPNNGPLVFLHDDDLIDDGYVSALAKSLPCGTSLTWQVYRPHRDIDFGTEKQRTEQEVASARDVAPLIRQTIFISHATPQDNAFVIWLASKLTSAGYDVWCDVANLSGGDGFWHDIEDVIRNRAAKVVFVQSEHVKGKSGTRKEVYLALKVGDRNQLPRFVVPMRIDATPFDDTLIELIDIQAIDCRRDWLTGLKSLLALLQRDGVPRTSTFKADQFSNLVSKFGQATFALLPSEEILVSNLLPILAPPERINFFSCGGLQSNQLPDFAARLPIPAYAFYTHVGTTATRDQFMNALGSIGLESIHVGERASLSWTDFLAGRSGDLPAWKRGDARNNAFKMLHKAWARHLESRGASSGTLANERPFWFFADQHFVENKIRFQDYSGRSVRRQLVGYSAKRRLYWHFGVQGRCFITNDQFFFALTPHVTFSSDGKVPLPSKAQLHSLRRSFCRSWWNDRWRDLMQGFVAALAGEDGSLKIEIGARSPLEISATFARLASPVSLVSADMTPRASDIAGDDVVEDQWEDDVDEDEGSIADDLDNLESPTQQ